MQDPKKDASVKAGLEIAAHTNPERDTEKDADDLVHEREEEMPEESAAAEQDPDELVHEHHATPHPGELDEADLDDLVHGQDGGEA